MALATHNEDFAAVENRAVPRPCRRSAEISIVVPRISKTPHEIRIQQEVKAPGRQIQRLATQKKQTLLCVQEESYELTKTRWDWFAHDKI